MSQPALEERLRRRIAAEGPIGVADYMAEANAHYYATRDPFGAAGDFTTAPEISQMFGELIGVWLADLWQRAGRPARRPLCRARPRPRHARRGRASGDARRRAGAAGRARRDQPGACARPRRSGSRRAGTTTFRRCPKAGRCSSSPTNFSTRCRSGSSMHGGGNGPSSWSGGRFVAPGRGRDARPRRCRSPSSAASPAGSPRRAARP